MGPGLRGGRPTKVFLREKWGGGNHTHGAAPDKPGFQLGPELRRAGFLYARLAEQEENNASNLSEATACQQHCPQPDVSLRKEGSCSQRRLCSAALMLMPGETHLVGGESSTYVLLWGEHKGERGKRVRRACSQPSWLCRGAGFAGLETASHSSGTFLAPFNIQTLWSIVRTKADSDRGVQPASVTTSGSQGPIPDRKECPRSRRPGSKEKQSSETRQLRSP
ncbi:Transmembrane Protein 79 [Manis pentadactyla]|nr:Transmembrane Protein 79 [Manis pentadactyla]